LKEAREVAVVTLVGRLFHTRAAVMPKLLIPGLKNLQKLTSNKQWLNDNTQTGQTTELEKNKNSKWYSRTNKRRQKLTKV